MMTNFAMPALQAHYDAMWSDAFRAIAAGDIDCDTRLAAGPDPRRGLTLIARPSAALQARFDVLLDRLANAEPGQYRYPAPDMHVTILSLLTVNDSPASHLAQVDEYSAAVRAAVNGIAPFQIDFDGLTLSRSAVMARGFPRGEALGALRDNLRVALRASGLDASLDQRYRLVTAHATLLRFIAPLRDPAGFGRLLACLRDQPLGAMHVDQVELVSNDWYMSSKAVNQITTVPL